MNYVSQYQDVIAGYRATNKAKLQSITARLSHPGIRLCCSLLVNYLRNGVVQSLDYTLYLPRPTNQVA